MTDKDQLILENLRLLWDRKIAPESALDFIRNVLSAPTQDGTAEEVLKPHILHEDHLGNRYIGYEQSLLQMTSYAAPLLAEIERLKSELAASVSPKLVMPSDEIKLNESDKYGFRVPYDGSNNFYDRVAIKQFEDGWNACLSELRRLYPSLFK